MPLILVAVLLITLVFLLNYADRNAKNSRRELFRQHGIPTQARILSAEPSVAGRKSVRKYYYHLSLRYCDQQNNCYTIQLRVPDSPDTFLYAVGDELPIWYNPLNPMEVELMTPPPQNMKHTFWFSRD